MISNEVRHLIDSDNIKDRIDGWMRAKGFPSIFNIGAAVGVAAAIEKLIKENKDKPIRGMFRFTTGSIVADVTAGVYLIATVVSVCQAFNEAGYNSRTMTTIQGLGVALGLSQSEIFNIDYEARKSGWL